MPSDVLYIVLRLEKMATPKSPMWECDPHTAAKHAILRHYLQAWFPILGQGHPRIVYLDGFAGPGEYVDRAPGSPLIALDVALEQKTHLEHAVVFFFVEADPRRAEHLRGLVEQRRRSDLSDNFELDVRQGEFAAELEQVLDEIDAEGLTLAPTFAFIDPFGWKGLPMRLIHRLLRHQRTEAFINFSINAINRFLTHPEPAVRREMIELFGTEDGLTIHTGTGDRHQALRELYGRQLSLAAEHVRFFSMSGPDGQPLYDLFFATNNVLGLEKMKEAMWRSDPEAGLRFSDRTDPHQSVLFDADEHAPTALYRLVMNQFTGREGVLVAELKEWTVVRTAFLPTHLRAALATAERQRMIRIQSMKRGGGTRRKGTFPPDALVDFVPEPSQGDLFA